MLAHGTSINTSSATGYCIRTIAIHNLQFGACVVGLQAAILDFPAVHPYHYNKNSAGSTNITKTSVIMAITETR
jgi:hypothetical protein